MGVVTVGLASHWPRVTDISGSPPTVSKPGRVRRAPAYAVLMEYGEFHVYLYNEEQNHHSADSAMLPKHAAFNIFSARNSRACFVDFYFFNGHTARTLSSSCTSIREFIFPGEGL